METARRVDLDFIVQGPAPFTHFDVKSLVGSEILKKQGQTISLEEMAYKIGQNIVNQKHRFVGIENCPSGVKPKADISIRFLEKIKRLNAIILATSPRQLGFFTTPNKYLATKRNRYCNNSSHIWSWNKRGTDL